MGELSPVLWEGHAVSFLKDPRWRLHGCTGLWVPASPPSESFAAALGRVPKVPLLVSVGGVRALAEQPPSASGELSVFWLGPSAEPSAAADRGRL